MLHVSPQREWTVRGELGYGFFAGLRYRYPGDRTGTGVYYFLGRVFGLTAHGMSDWVGDAIGEAVWSIGYGIYWLLSRS